MLFHYQDWKYRRFTTGEKYVLTKAEQLHTWERKQHNQSFSCSWLNQLSIKSLAVRPKNLISSDLQCKEAIDTETVRGITLRECHTLSLEFCKAIKVISGHVI